LLLGGALAFPLPLLLALLLDGELGLICSDGKEDAFFAHGLGRISGNDQVMVGDKEDCVECCVENVVSDKRHG
jgi:hypothetical protein